MPSSTKSTTTCQDRVSNLPQDVIESILICLSLRNVVRTSILSRRWRHKWRSLPHLIFDRKIFKGITRTHDRLVIAMLEVACHHTGNIKKFVLSLPGLKSCPQIDLVISLVSQNCGFKDFTLEILEGDKPYKLPLSLFSWAELNCLSLCRCVIEPPIHFKGFNRLVRMQIDNCCIRPDVLSGLISSSLILEEATVESPIPIEGNIEISAPNLRKLTLVGQVASICFKYTPLLSECRLYEYPGTTVVEGNYSNLFQSLHNLTAIMYLALSYYYVGDKSYSGSIPRKLTTTLYNLRVLLLWNISFCQLHEVSRVLSLIRSSPNLVKVVAVTSAARSNVGWDHTLRLFQVPESTYVCLNSLRTVYLGISGVPPELSFIELLLTKSPKLEEMLIEPDIGVALEKKLEIRTKVASFHRLSPIAKVML